MKDFGADYLRQWIAEQENLARLCAGVASTTKLAISHDEIEKILGIGRHDPSNLLASTRSLVEQMKFGPAVLGHLAIDSSALAGSLADQAALKNFASSVSVPRILEGYQLHTEELIKRMTSRVDVSYWTRDVVDTFGAASALAGVFETAQAIRGFETKAAAAFTGIELPSFPDIRSFGVFLDAAGLSLPHWPRLLTQSERRKRLKQRIAERRPPAAMRRAYDLTYRYESLLREVTTTAMEDTYGTDWPRARLPQCNCKDLIGRWDRGGGDDVLAHADFAHYERIIVHPDHFLAIFQYAFETPEIASDLIGRARMLRARSHHAGSSFSNDDLRELRIVWNEIAVALDALTPYYLLSTD